MRTFILIICSLLCVASLMACGPATSSENTTEEAKESPAQEPPDERPSPSDASGHIDSTSPDQSACVPGSQACRCRSSQQCDAGLRCDTGLCVACPKGTAGCPCKDKDACDGGLRCESGRCAGCEGKHGCPCYQNNTCDTGHQCVNSVYNIGTCRKCAQGKSLECFCDADQECGEGLICLNRQCFPKLNLNQIPSNPKCYSPCRGDIQNPDGTLQVCHPTYKLLDGCQFGLACNQGSCLKDKIEPLNKEYPFCKDSADCPHWQSCVSGRCYSTCSSHTDCQKGTICHSYVCRRTCTTKQENCAPNETCVTQGQEDGVCTVQSTRYQISDAQTKTRGTFELPVRHLGLSNITSSGLLYIHNKSAFPSAFSISRKSDGFSAKLPLQWLHFATCKTYASDRKSCQSFETPSAKEPFVIDSVGADETIIIQLSKAGEKPGATAQYEGILEVKNEAMGTRELTLSYQDSGDGQWKGTIVSFGHFNASEKDIEKFPADKSLPIKDVSNALLRRWLNLKRGDMSVAQFRAVLRSIREKTWDQPKVKADCKKGLGAGSDDVICYPYTSSTGYEVLTPSNREAPVPSGTAELHFAINVKEQSGHLFVGRIDSGQTLHYPGNPEIRIGFHSKPGSTGMTLIKSFGANVQMGGRYALAPGKACEGAAEFVKVEIPWLVPGFQAGTSKGTGLFPTLGECRSRLVPQQASATTTTTAAEQFNLSMSAANPIPNGWTLQRKLEFVDGALLENRYLFVLLRERFSSFFAAGSSNTNVLAKDFVSYGYIMLERASTDLSTSDFKGNVAPSSCQQLGCAAGKVCLSDVCQPKVPRLPQVQCAPDVVKMAMGQGISSHTDLSTWSSNNLETLAHRLLHGQEPQQTASTIKADSNGEYSYTHMSSLRYIHVLCEDNGTINDGPDNAGNRDCPIGSKVTFFEVEGLDNNAMRQLPCQVGTTKGSCTQQHIERLKGFRAPVAYRCSNSNEVLCDRNRDDLRKGKEFFPQPPNAGQYQTPFQSLRIEMVQAFRYRLKFANRNGGTIGFTPEQCQPNSSLTPYCYAPPAIELLQQRVSCLQAIYTDQQLNASLSTQMRGQVKVFLALAFSYKNTTLPDGTLQSEQGFESLNAELKIMLGDEAYVKAFASRYDLAGSSLISFAGEAFEANGISLSGALGFELHNLYLSTQYYQMVLDRFFSQSGLLVHSFSSADTKFLTFDAIASYFKKVLLASTRKARSMSQIAKKYHLLNRADLAQGVIERAYASSYIEMTIFTRLLRELALQLDARQIAQIRLEIQQVMLTYKAAFIEMEEVYKSLRTQLNSLGLPNGYIPFPALDHLSAQNGTNNAFAVSLQYAKEKMGIARQKELFALQSKRSFDTDAASFQSELVRIRQNYESQLLDICGGLKDGNNIVPAIPKYAYLDPQALQLGNPCGRFNSGRLYDAYVQLEKIRVGLGVLKISHKNTQAQIDLEKQRLQEYCDKNFELSKVTWEFRKEKHDLQTSSQETQMQIDRAMRIYQDVVTLANLRKCDGFFECTNVISSSIAVLLAAGAREGALELLNDKLAEKQELLAARERDFEKRQLNFVCDNPGKKPTPDAKTRGTALIESDIKIKQLTNHMLRFQLEALQAQYDIQLALSAITRLEQQARRLMTEQAESEQMSVNVQAARNDPNVRIYKNDAIITAERTFDDALREAYRATLIYEYYTGQSYARKGNIYLIRMITAGDLNLEAYLSRLEQAFREFEEQNGKPDTRVMVLSLRDDIIQIPRKTADGSPKSLNQRVKEFQAILSDRERLNSEGFSAFPFSLSVSKGDSKVSPITINHKLLYVEAEIIGADVGDAVGRIYLRQRGTGVIRLPSNDMKFYALPPRTAVINPFLNGTKIFAPNIYQNFRLRDRPLGNTHWEVLFNQVSEKANQDINLNSVSDIRMYLYYSDFTQE